MARTYLLVFFVLLSLPLLAQQVDLENIDTQLKEKLKKKPFSISGSASVSGVYVCITRPLIVPLMNLSCISSMVISLWAFTIGRCRSIIDTPIKEML